MNTKTKRKEGKKNSSNERTNNLNLNNNLKLCIWTWIACVYWTQIRPFPSSSFPIFFPFWFWYFPFLLLLFCSFYFFFYISQNSTLSLLIILFCFIIFFVIFFFFIISSTNIDRTKQTSTWCVITNSSWVKYINPWNANKKQNKKINDIIDRHDGETSDEEISGERKRYVSDKRIKRTNK